MKRGQWVRKGKKVKFKIIGTAYLDEKYTQRDMLAFNKNRILPPDVKKQIAESIVNRKRSYHLSIVGDDSINWESEYFGMLAKISDKWGIQAKKAVVQFLSIYGDAASDRRKFLIAEELFVVKTTQGIFINALFKTIEKNIPSVRYAKIIMYSMNKKNRKEIDISRGKEDRSKELIEKLQKYEV